MAVVLVCRPSAVAIGSPPPQLLTQPTRYEPHGELM